MCVSTVSTGHDWTFETTRTVPALDLPLPPLDEKRFRFIEVLAQQDRRIGQIELYHDYQQNCKVVGKRMLRSWTLGSAKEFGDEHPDLLESPWKELALSLFVGSTEMKGICKCFGAFEDSKGDVLIVLEYICGGDIHDLARRCMTEPGPEREAKAWPVILSLLGAVHIGVAHGDISLENALLSPDGEVRLIDFAASVTDSRTRGIRGKPSYQAPEMHTPNSYDPFAADLFACGVFAYCLVVADYPWRCTSPNKCAAFDFYLLHGLPAFLAQRKVRFEGMQRRPVQAILSQKLTHLLSVLLDPVPERRTAVWQELREMEPVEVEIQDTSSAAHSPLALKVN